MKWRKKDISKAGYFAMVIVEQIMILIFVVYIQNYNVLSFYIEAAKSNQLYQSVHSSLNLLKIDNSIQTP